LRKLAGFERLRDEGLESGLFVLEMASEKVGKWQVSKWQVSKWASGKGANGKWQGAWMEGGLIFATCFLPLASSTFGLRKNYDW
jgi:hypothetical protein